MLPTLIALLLSPTASAQAVDVAAVFADAQAEPGSPLVQPGTRVELWGIAGFTVPDQMLATDLHGAFVLETSDRKWRVRIEKANKPESGPPADGPAKVELLQMDFNEAYGGQKPEEKEYQRPITVARVAHAAAVLRVIGKATEREDDGGAKKAAKAIADELRQPLADVALEQPEALAGTRLKPITEREHGFTIDLCPGGAATYTYDGTKPLSQRVPVSESTQEAAGTWGATADALHLSWEDGTTWVLPRGEGVTGYSSEPSEACK